MRDTCAVMQSSIGGVSHAAWQQARICPACDQKPIASDGRYGSDAMEPTPHVTSSSRPPSRVGDVAVSMKQRFHQTQLDSACTESCHRCRSCELAVSCWMCLKADHHGRHC